MLKKTRCGTEDVLLWQKQACQETKSLTNQKQFIDEDPLWDTEQSIYILTKKQAKN